MGKEKKQMKGCAGQSQDMTGSSTEQSILKMSKPSAALLLYLQQHEALRAYFKQGFTDAEYT